MTTKTLATTLTIALLAMACGEDEAQNTDETVTAAAQPTDEGAAAEEPLAAEVEAAPEAAGEQAATHGPPAEGETTTLLALREGFAADSAAWEGQTVTVQAQFMSATRVGGSLNNISLVVSREDYAEDRRAHSMMCAFGEGAPESIDLVQYGEVTVRGTVVERFGRAGLEDCVIVD